MVASMVTMTHQIVGITLVHIPAPMTVICSVTTSLYEFKSNTLELGEN